VDFLWSPWRYKYVSTATESDGCVFCVGEASSQDAGQLILHRGHHNFVIMNLYPYTSGHVMVAPYAHISEMSQTESPQLSEMMSLARDSVAGLDEIYRPEGYNIGMNVGQSAGAGIKDHLHLHVVPRWTGDTNFMTVTGETRVLPEDLQVTYEKLKPYFE